MIREARVGEVVRVEGSDVCIISRLSSEVTMSRNEELGEGFSVEFEVEWQSDSFRVALLHQPIEDGAFDVLETERDGNLAVCTRKLAEPTLKLRQTEA